VDNFPGTAGNDTYNTTTANLNSFDNLAAGAGVDTLNFADSGTALFAIPPSVTFSGFETVAVSRINTGTTTGAVAITNTTFGTGVTTLSYTEASGTGAMTGATASAILNDATSVTFAATGGGVFTTVDITDTSTVAGSTGSKLTSATVTGSTGAITLTGNGLTSVTLNNDTGLATVTAAAGTRAMTVNTAGTVGHGGFTDAQATTLNISNTGIATLGTFTAAKATTVNYTSTAANTSMTLTAAAATTLNVSGTKLATMTLTGNTALATVNVTGSAGLTTDLTAGATAVTLLDTSGTTGITTATVNLGTAVTGGAGNDNITVGATTKAINLGGSTAVAAVTGTSIAIPAANKVTLTSGTVALGSGGSINGGTGSADVLSMVAADAAALTTSGASAAGPTAFRAAVTGFEVLELAAAAGTITVDEKAVGSTFNQVNITGAAQTVNLNNMSNGDTLQITGANTAVVLGGSSGAGVDTINIKLVNTGNALAAFGSVTAPNSETVVINSVDAQVTPVGYYNTLTVVDAAASVINIVGNSGVALTFAGTALSTFDASGVTLGGVTFTSAAQAYATTVKGTVKGGDTLNFDAALAAVTITETAGTNVITGSNTIASTLTGGSGADTIFGGSGADTIVGGAGADTIYADNAGAKRVETYTITTAGAGTATLTLAGVATTVTYATSGDNTIGLLQTALAADARYGKLFTSAVTVNAPTTTDDVLTVTWLADGTNIGSATTSAGTLAINTTGSNATVVAGTQVTAGTVGTSGKNVITGGTGADTFIFGVASTTPSATTFQTITDFGSASDIIDFSALALTIVTNATASSGTAAISASGIATFAAGDNTLALRLVATEAAINAGGTATAGQVAVFQMDSDAYVFISNGTDGVGAGDQLLKLTGVNTLDSAYDVVTLANGNMTLA